MKQAVLQKILIISEIAYIFLSICNSYDLIEGCSLPLPTGESSELISSSIVDKTQQLYFKQNWEN